jgi:iron complex outermembrane recepter protein
MMLIGLGAAAMRSRRLGLAGATRRIEEQGAFAMSYHFRPGVRRAAMGALLASIAMPALLAAAPAAAQEATATTVNDPDEIVVTGTRRGDASVKDTALAVSAFSGETLERANVTSLADIASIDPSVNIQSYGAAQTKIVLRGIDSNVGAVSALYLNEAAVLGGIGGNVLGDGKPGIRLHDIDRLEVLKGPQGTLFGTSSMSGTLRVITRKPELDKWSVNGEINLAAVEGGNPYAEASATVNVPIVSDTLGIRVTGWAETGGGFIDQTIRGTTFENGNDADVRGARGEAMWRIAPGFTLNLTALHQTIDVGGTQAFEQSRGAYQNISPTVEFYKDKYSLVSLSGDYDLGFGSIIATGSYSKQDVRNSKDSTPTNISFGVNAPLNFVANVDFEDYNAELRFSSRFDGPVQLVAGLYYENTDSEYETAAIQAPNFRPACYDYVSCRPFVAAGRGRSIYEFGTNTRRTIDQYAAYAQVDWDVLPTVTLTGGIRYFKADIRDIVTNLQTVFPDFVFGRVTVPSVTGDQTGSNEKPSYNAAALWRATPDISLYARAASGFRIGGVNTATSLAQQAGVTFPGTYDPDSLWSYEVGVKGFLANRAIFFDLAGYRVDWSNQQLSAQSAGAFAYTLNAGKTVSNGIEFTTTVRLPAGFSFNGNVTYVDSTLARDLPAAVVAAGTIGRKGDRVPLSPRWSASAAAEYETPVASDVTGYASARISYKGDSYSSFNRATAFDTYLPAYTLIGAQLGIRGGSGWDIGIYGENLGNEVPYLGVVPSLDGTRIFTARPRTFGLRLRSGI